MKNFNKLTRRDLVKMFGFAGAMATPLLRQTRAFAANSMQPIYIQLFKPNGNPDNAYYPNVGTGGSLDFTSKVTESLQYVNEYVISPRPLTLYRDAPNTNVRGNVHSSAIVRCFSNSSSEGVPNDGHLAYKPCKQPSIDHIIADHLYQSDTSKLRHFHFKFRTDNGYGNYPLDTTSFKLSQGSNITESQFAINDIKVMFNTLIGRIGSCTGNNVLPADPKISVLDFNLEQVRSMKSKLNLSIHEKAKLEEFETQINLIQNKINSLSQNQNTCPALLLNPNYALWAKENLERARVIMDLIALAVEWELTHVASFMFDSAQGGGNYGGFLSFQPNDGHHSLSHDGSSLGMNNFRIVSKFQWDQFGYFLKKLKDTKTIDGKNLLDIHLALVSGGEVSVTSGNNHSHDNMPFFTVGKANGALTTGRSVTPASGTKMNSHGRLLLSVCRAMGNKQLQYVGDVDKCPGGPLIETLG